MGHPVRSDSYPLRLDPVQERKVAPTTITRYQKAAKPFVKWCLDHGYEPWTPEDWDDGLVEYRADASQRVTKFQLENLVAAVEFYFP